MSVLLSEGRRWSQDGGLLMAPDMNEHVGTMLERAKAEYGPAHWGDGWSIGAVVFGPENPSVRRIPSLRAAVIVLPKEGADDMQIAMAFLAHELIHCLHLHGGEHAAPMIEEGAAVRFSIMEAQRCDPHFGAVFRHHQTTSPQAEHYAEALWAVEDLLEADPEAIRKLRAATPAWDAITPKAILDVVPDFDPYTVCTLCDVREMRPDWEGDAARAVTGDQGARQ